MYSEEEIGDIQGLLKEDCLRRLTPPRPPAQVKANLPVKHLTGWLYYGTAFQ